MNVDATRSKLPLVLRQVARIDQKVGRRRQWRPYCFPRAWLSATWLNCQHVDAYSWLNSKCPLIFGSFEWITFCASSLVPLSLRANAYVPLFVARRDDVTDSAVEKRFPPHTVVIPRECDRSERVSRGSDRVNKNHVQQELFLVSVGEWNAVVVRPVWIALFILSTRWLLQSLAFLFL